MNKKTLINLYSTKDRTLKTIWEKLEIKQSLSNYEKNTSKKYGIHINRKDILSQEVFDLILLNTLGKLGRHREQAFYINELKNELIVSEGKSERDKKAQKFAELRNLTNNIVKMTSLILDDNKNDWDIKQYFENKREPNIKYIYIEEVRAMLKDKLLQLIKVYKDNE